MVHPQGNGIVQNTKYEEIIKVVYVYKLEIRLKHNSMFKLLHLQAKQHIDNSMVFI